MNDKYTEKIIEAYDENPQQVYANTLNTFVRGVELAKIVYSEHDLKKLKKDILKTIESIKK